MKKVATVRAVNFPMVVTAPFQFLLVLPFELLCTVLGILQCLKILFKLSEYCSFGLKERRRTSVFFFEVPATQGSFPLETQNVERASMRRLHGVTAMYNLECAVH